jgi:hypothetical protein
MLLLGSWTGSNWRLTERVAAVLGRRWTERDWWHFTRRRLRHQAVVDCHNGGGVICGILIVRSGTVRQSGPNWNYTEKNSMAPAQG